MLAAGLAAAFLATTARAAPITFKTSDGWTLSGWYVPPQGDKDVVILVHSASATAASEEWRDFSRKLHALGLGTLAFDMRGYGKSLQGPYGPSDHRGFNDMDWQSTVLDVDGAFDYLKAAGIPEDRVGLAGSMVGANVAAMAAARHPDAAWLVLLSPSNDYHGLSVGEGGSLPTLLVAGQNDESSLTVCRSLQDLDASRELYIGPDGRGVRLLEDPSLSKRVLGWIADQQDSSGQ